FSGDSAPMGIALSGGLFAGSAGVTDVRIGIDDTSAGQLLVAAEIGSHATGDATGEGLVTASSTYEGIIRAEGGAIGAIAVGAMIARGDEVSTTRARVNSNAGVSAGKLTVSAQNTSDVTVGTVSAAGGIGAGVGTSATAFVTPKVFASIENDAT